MQTNRLEAFSDGVLAIIITIMMLELKVPRGVDLAALLPVLPVFASYVLSFLYVGIYWNHHHHLLLHSTETRERRHLVGESAPVVLAIAVSLLHGMDGPEPRRACAHGGVRRRASDGRHRPLSLAARHSVPRGAQLIPRAACFAPDAGGTDDRLLSSVIFARALARGDRPQKTMVCPTGQPQLMPLDIPI
jgi:hypothetical protein